MASMKVSDSGRESLSRNKEMVLAAMKSSGHTAKFKSFCKSQSMDSFLHACIDYFTIFFDVRKIEEDEAAAAAKRAEALANGERPSDLAAAASSRGKELRAKELEQQAQLRNVALVYATILLKHSNYSNTQQERQFFESLYDFSKRVLFTINNRRHWHAIENELDRVFRSPHFNLSQRKNKANAQGSHATTSFKELFEKQGGAEGFARLMGDRSSSHKSNIHKALLMRSPIISEIFPTPKERAERAARLAADLADQQVAEDAESERMPHSTSAAPRGTHRSSRADTQGQHDESAPHLEGEEAMDALVQETSRSFTEFVG